ncbi:MAG: type I-B CRISPR-associated protein Cas7/Csh2 [Nitrososphaerales archaeon]
MNQTYLYRSEILFLYDIFRCNPNGDPFENRPRVDPATGRIDVTDVRLKRTIRDYILNYKHKAGENDGLDIFVRTTGDEAVTAERRYEELFKSLPQAGAIEEAKKNLIKRCIDVRLFGALVPITKKEKKAGKEIGEKTEEGEDREKGEEKGAGIQITGAVQFNPGQSLHAAEVFEIAGTGGFASKEKAKQRTFRREFIVPYALIGFYGVINENLAKYSGLTQTDVNILMDSMWQGTLALHSRSKSFHHPRLLVRLDYKDQRQCGFFLDKLRIHLKEVKDEKAIRSLRDYTLEIGDWLTALARKKGFINNIYSLIDPEIPLAKDGSPIDSVKLQQALNALI